MTSTPSREIRNLFTQPSSSPDKAATAIVTSLIVLGLTVQAIAGTVAPQAMTAPVRARDPMENPPSTGYIPPMTDLSHLQARTLASPLTFPARFDWRESGKVTPVRNQGYCGSCYAFAAIAGLESRMLIEIDRLYDFSENNVKECEWFESSCGGGNDWVVANYLTTAGTVFETCDPYIPSDVECKASCRYRKTLQDWYVISGSVPAPVDVLKTYMMAYGPVYTTLYVGNGDSWQSEFSAYDGSYTLFNDAYHTPNHAVLIVGWDDTLSHAGGQGAWIAKNSWGTSWGGTCGYGAERGYFAIAYGSAAIGTNSSFAARLEDYSPSDTLLYHDEGGFGGSIGIMNSRTIWGLCKFEASRDIEISRVELWTVDATVDIDIYIYNDFDGLSPAGLLTSSLDHSFDLAGYHSVLLEHPMMVRSGEDIFTVVKLTNAVSKFPLAYDSSGPESPGSSYFSSDGTCFYEFVNGDLGIRLRASTDPACAGVTAVPAILDIRDVPGDGGGCVSISWARSMHDDTEAGAIKRYRIWRKRKGTALPVLTASVAGGQEIGGPYQHGTEEPAWEIVGTVEAIGTCCYEFIAPTICNCMPPDTCWTSFCITAHTGVPGEHFDSPVGRGYSIDNLGTLTRPGHSDTEPQEMPGPVPEAVVLTPPSPNPSLDGFSIRFELTRPNRVDITVYDVYGQQVAKLAEGLKPAGAHLVQWRPGFDQATKVPPGMYFLRLATPSATRTTRLVLTD